MESDVKMSKVWSKDERVQMVISCTNFLLVYEVHPKITMWLRLVDNAGLQKTSKNTYQ